MVYEERILQFISREGPVLPHQLARFLGTNLIIAGAHLSELASRNKVIISSLKVGGGSPVYYLPGQEEKLQNYYEDLNEKDKRSFLLLRERKILRDKELDALTRVSLRNIKDFAKPLEVNLNNEKEIFWRWYLIKSEEAGGLIREFLKPPVEEKKEVVEEIKEKALVKEERGEEAEQEKIIEEKKKEPTKKVEEKKEELRVEIKPKREVEPKLVDEVKEEKQEILEEPKIKNEIQKEIQSDFLEKIKNFLNLKNIKIQEAEVLRKTEINMVLGVPTAIGEILYYAKAKNKKKCNDKDVSSAFLEGQMKKLPVVFLYEGEMTKKTEEMIKQDIFKNLILLQIK